VAAGGIARHFTPHEFALPAASWNPQNGEQQVSEYQVSEQQQKKLDAIRAKPDFAARCAAVARVHKEGKVHRADPADVKTIQGVLAEREKVAARKAGGNPPVVAPSSSAGRPVASKIYAELEAQRLESQRRALTGSEDVVDCGPPVASKIYEQRRARAGAQATGPYPAVVTVTPSERPR
jgi:hypothetical protein